jgi:AcrR family transcriptional regulator
VPTSPRQGAPTEKRARVQRDVLQAAEELLGDGASYAELNVEQIANRAGISRTAFYFYFGDKREVLMRLAEGVIEELYEQADIWYSGSDAEPDIRRALARIGDTYSEHGPLLKAVIELSTYDEEIGAFWRNLIGRFAEATQRQIEAEQSRGGTNDLPPRATALALTWMGERTFYQHLLAGHPGDLQDVVDALTCIYLRTIYGR